MKGRREKARMEELCGNEDLIYETDIGARNGKIELTVKSYIVRNASHQTVDLKGRNVSSGGKFLFNRGQNKFHCLK